MEINKLKKYSPIILRIGISLVFLWFGINQLINPELFLGYIPQWLISHSFEIAHEHPLQLIHNIPKYSIHFLVMGNGLFEIIFGLFLLIGLFIRVSSLLLSIHLFIITLSLGYNDLAIRDLGLTIAVFSIFIHGADSWSLDGKIKKVNNNLNNL